MRIEQYLSDMIQKKTGFDSKSSMIIAKCIVKNQKTSSIRERSNQDEVGDVKYKDFSRISR